MKPLLDAFPRAGSLTWIGLSPASRAPVQDVEDAELLADSGLVGDYHDRRDVTLINAEHLPVIAIYAGLPAIDAATLRRNLVVSGLNLMALKGKRFRVGSALLEYTGPCDPCRRMEQALGRGGLNAMRGLGGICAHVLEGGAIRVGDPVTAVVERDASGQLDLDLG